MYLTPFIFVYVQVFKFNLKRLIYECGVLVTGLHGSRNVFKKIKLQTFRLQKNLKNMQVYKDEMHMV